MIKSSSELASTEETYRSLLTELELEELKQSQSGSEGAIFYSKLLALYIYFHDYDNARLLWKRIPKQVKEADNPGDLQKLWAVGRKMVQKDRLGIYQELAKGNWTDSKSPVASIMIQIKTCVQIKARKLISEAYTSVSVPYLADSLGLTSEEEVLNEVKLLGWHINPDTKMVTPGSVREGGDFVELSNADQITTLNRFVSYLEK